MNSIHDATKSSKEQAPSPGLLVFVRHAESEWNALGKWTGRTDVHLSEKGHREAVLLGEAIDDIEFHYAYLSEQIRTLETFNRLLETAAQKESLSYEHSAELNERDYGEYTGLNKWEVLDKLGEETFTSIRRGWDHPIPGGETMKMVYERAVPFYKARILPKLLAGENVMVVSHGNTLRALMKYMEDVSDEGIADLEMPFDHIPVYRVTPDGKRHSKEIRKIDIVLPKA